MKTDIKYKTISNSNSLTSSKIKKLNSQIKKEQKNEKEFKSHLIKKLKSLKLNQKNKDKIPLNIASKIRREESIRNSLKSLLAKQAQFDKKELLYYKAYFRFWKRKCKYEKYDIKKINKKDKNIRITTVIYKADKPNIYKNNVIIEESKNENNERKKEFFRNKLKRIIESKSKDKITKKDTIENKNNKYSEKNSKNNIINNINKNIQPLPNNIKAIKNIINENQINNIKQIKQRK